MTWNPEHYASPEVRAAVAAIDRLKTPVVDERKACERCGRPFRCPTAQAERIICGPCR